MSKKISFLKTAVKSIKTSGTVTPSSRFLIKKMLKVIDFSEAKVIVELGPGNGSITNYVLRKMNKNATLICFEINDTFYNDLLRIENSQLIVIKQSAEHITEALVELGFTEVDCVISSLPLAILPKKIAFDILTNTKKVLKNNGIFLQYQYSLSFYKKLKAIFDDDMILSFEFLNIPPAFIYTWRKTDKE